jgi:hypothetical protein
MENLSKTVKRTLFSGSLASSPMPEVMMLWQSASAALVCKDSDRNDQWSYV